MIIVAHLIMFAALYGLGLPALHAVFGDSVNFAGGPIALVAMAAVSEVVVIAAALIARTVTLGFKINPLLQRDKAESIANATIAVALFGFYMAASALLPAVITMTWYWALPVVALVLGLLEVMVRVKRRIISRMP